MAGWQKDARDKLVSFRLKSYTRLVSSLLLHYTLQSLYNISHYSMDLVITYSHFVLSNFTKKLMEFKKVIIGN